MALNLIINSFGLIQYTILIKKIDFRTNTKISLISLTCSGAVGIFMAYKGFGAWSLVMQALMNNLSRTLLLWFFSKWKPSLRFSFSSLRSLFSFGSKLLVSGLLDQIFDNIYKLIIGRAYSSTTLGFYSQAKRIQEIPVLSLSQIVQRVTYPVYSKIQEEIIRLKNAYRKTINAVIFLNFPIMLSLIVIANPLIKVLLTEKWMPAVPYLRLLCIIGFLYPLSAINLNILKVRGRSDIFLYLEVAKKTLITIAILITLRRGVFTLVIGQVITAFIATFINIYFSGKLIRYSLKEQLMDILPNLALASIMAISMYLIGQILLGRDILSLFVQIFLGTCSYLFLARSFRFDTYSEFLSILKDKMSFCFINKKRAH
jgi:O-antigen/teichoic acid export membrane protein